MNNTTDSRTTPSFRDYTEYHIAEKIWIIVSPILIFMGTITNILSVVVLVQKRMRSSTTMFYLMVLAIGDILVLSTGLFGWWLRFAFKDDVRTVSQFSCKVHVFLVYFSLDFTTWILVAVTVDRCISVCLPFRAKLWCTMKHARITAAVIGIVMVAINFHLFWGMAVIREDGEKFCTPANEFTARVWPWIDLCILSIFPFIVMIICNICIIRKVVHSRRKIISYNEAESNQYVSETTFAQNASNQTSGIQMQNHKPGAKMPKVTAMLLSVNCVFLLLTLPIVIYLIIISYIEDLVNAHETAIMFLFHAIVNMLQYTNNSVHFFLYCLTGPRFRKELHSLFSRLIHIKTSVTTELH